MAKTTGFTATTVLRMIAKGLFDRKGICPPEYIGRISDCVVYVLNELKRKGILYNLTIKNLE
jgi:saccharopine dehydrogenase-like NADP-dependent oxidoreductase